MGGGKFKLKKLIHGSLNDSNSERLYSSTPMRRMSRTGNFFRSLIFATGVGMGITASLMPKVSSADVKAIMDTVKKKDKVADAIEVMEGKFEKIKEINKKKKKNMPMALSSAKKEVDNFMKALENYLADFDIKPEGKTTAEKMQWLNEYLEVETDYPTFVTPQTIEALEIKIIWLNSTLQDDMLEDMAADLIAKTEPKTPFTKPAEPEKEEVEAETVPTLAVTPTKELDFASKKLIERIDEALIECDKYSLVKQKEKLEGYKEKILEKHESGKTLSNKFTKEINNYLKGVEVKINAAKKKIEKEAEEAVEEAVEEVEAPVPLETTGMAFTEKIDYYYGLLESLNTANKYLGIKDKQTGIRYKELKKLHDIQEKEAKGKKLKKKENKILAKAEANPQMYDGTYNYVLGKLKTIAEMEGDKQVLSGKPLETFKANIEIADKEENKFNALESAVKLLANESMVVVAYNFQEANKHINRINKAIKAKKLGKKIKLPKYPKTVAGSYEAILWVLEKEKTVYAEYVKKSANKAALSEGTQEAVQRIAEIHVETASLLDSYAQTGSKEDAKSLANLAMEEANLWLEHYDEIGKGNITSAMEALELAQKYYDWVFDEDIPIDVNILLPYKVANNAIQSLAPETFRKYEEYLYMTGAQNDVNAWVTGLNGVSVAKVLPFDPLYGAGYMSGSISASGIDATYARLEGLETLPFVITGTEPEMHPSAYGPTVGLAEYYESEFPGKSDIIKDLAVKYGEPVDVLEEVEKKAAPEVDEIYQNKKESLAVFFSTYGKGLAKLDENTFFLVPATALTVFNETKNAISENGHVTAKKGELKSVQLAELFYESASMVDSKEAYEDLTTENAKAQAKKLYNFLNKEGTLPKEFKTDSKVEKAMNRLLTVESPQAYVEALIYLQNVTEFGLGSIYSFSPAYESERFFRAADVNENVATLPLLESQKIALVEIAAEDAELAKKNMDSGRLTIYLPEAVEEKIEEGIIPSPPVEIMGPYPKIAAEQQPPINIVYAVAEEPQLVADISKITEETQQALGGKDNASNVIDAWVDATQMETSKPDDVAGAASGLLDSLPDELGIGSSADKGTYQDAIDKLAQVSDPESENYGNQTLLEDAMNDLRDITTIGGQLDSAYTEWAFKADRNVVGLAKLGAKLELHLINPVVFEKIQKGEEAQGFVEAFLSMGGYQLETPGEWIEYAYEGSEKVPTGEKAKGKAVQKEGSLGAGVKFVTPISEKVQKVFGKNMLITAETEADFGVLEMEGEVPKGEEGETKKLKSKSATAKLSDLKLSVWFPDGVFFKGFGAGVANLYGAPGGFESVTPYMYGTLGYDSEVKGDKDVFLGAYGTGGVLMPIKEGDVEAAPFVGGSGVLGIKLNDKLYLFNSLGVTSTFNSLGGQPSLTVHGASELYIEPAGMALGLEGEYTYNLDKLDQNMGAVTGVIKFYFGPEKKKKKKKEKKTEEKKEEGEE